MTARFEFPVHLVRAWPPPAAPDGLAAFAFSVSLDAADEEREQPLLAALFETFARVFPAESFAVVSGGASVRPRSWDEARGEAGMVTLAGTDPAGAAMLLAGPPDAVSAALRDALEERDPRAARRPGLLAALLGWRRADGRVEYVLEGVHGEEATRDFAREVSRALGL